MPMSSFDRDRQEHLFLLPEQLPTAASHPFYRKLNQLLAETGFDAFIEEACRPLYKPGSVGRPSIPPGVYFRMLFIGYFEGIDSQRGIAWRCADSLGLREFLGLGITEATPDHSSLTRVRDRLDGEIHDKAFQFVLKVAMEKKLLEPKAVGVDGTTLEANAAMKSIVRKDTGEEYREYLRKLAIEAGIENPTAEDLQRFDRNREGKTCSNEEWESPVDPEAEVTKMKDGRTHLAYKAEHVIDLKSEFILAAQILPATAGDGSTLIDSVLAAQSNLDAAATLTPGARTEEEVAAATDAGPRIVEVAADKGYHKAETLEFAEELGLRTYIPERKRKRRKGAKKARPGRSKRKRACDSPAVKRNRERMKRAKGKGLGRRRSEVVERSFAHVCRTGGARRTQLRGKEKIRKRYSMAAAARNLGLLTLKLFGVGKPRSLQGARDRPSAALEGLLRLQERFLSLLGALWTDLRVVRQCSALFRAAVIKRAYVQPRAIFSTGC